MEQYVVDAFTDTIFKGNPAAVCVLTEWLPESTMTDIATENNLSETAFAVQEGENYLLRWFTPGGEINLCGHATLAAAFVILNFYAPGQASVSFDTMSGRLTVRRRGELYEMDFPAYELKKVPAEDQVRDAVGIRPREVYLGRDLVCVFDDPQAVLLAAPDQNKVKSLDGLLLHLTAPGIETDCISRTFAPKCGVAEDPVCGSGHCHLVPYWAKRLGKKEIAARQASPRGGTLCCRMEEGRVRLAGKAVLFSKAELFL